ncbi:Aldehyde/histidinol dehydrogenase [Pyronema domesticum]|uniref:glutamate-5-semialdehyde dehydrogenase n=1 Tax=Pyronema omphalodes (strain CBS 100304) TaxID=1076935 RepID=U4LHR9_PYROM|nr:Aldehyde/histidinol dehydrogenase [Pyronema domesticum]CCX16208.1 Similar to Probable gamma-glutamyl phosphate reductase; acc. no. Q9UT44 [Pyronema omphalodes CBS 100304]
MSTPTEIARTAALASRTLKAVSGDDRSAALTAVHDALAAAKDEILAANQKDMEAAQALVDAGKMKQSLAKRLLLSDSKWDGMLEGILDVRNLEDPVGKVTMATKLDDGLDLYRLTCPIGVLLVIFEARPEVIANITALALKSGNAAILKGGKESTASFAAIANVVSRALATTKIPSGAIQLVQTREDVSALLDQDQYIDLVIPRGGNDLVRYIKENTKIPVMGHADGLCAIYVHPDADAAKAVKVVVDAKTDYPAACNACETLLVHQDAATTLLPKIASALLEAGVSLRCDSVSKAALQGSDLDSAKKLILQDSTEEDYNTEFLELTVAVKVVSGLDEAVEHINQHGSGHTDAILTESKETAESFMNRVDSAGVFWNASTRFADGFRYGFGTEVGISTNKIHARGPVGLEGLTIHKYQLRGNGQGASDYGAGKKAYLHTKIEDINI